MRRWIGIGLGVLLLILAAPLNAQDGDIFTPSYILLVTPGEHNGFMCRGETMQVEVWLSDASQAPNGQQLSAPFGVHVSLLADSSNPSVARAVPSVGSPGRSNGKVLPPINVTGLQVGSTTVRVTATIQSTRFVSADEEVGLPVTHVVTVEGTAFVTVSECPYQVSINGIWETSLYRANSVLLIANAHDLRLEPHDTPGSYTFDPPVEQNLPPFLEWTFAVNRVPGCYAGSGTFSQVAPRIRAEIVDDHVELSLSYFEVAPPLNGFWDQLCRPYESGQPCSARPDGICPVFAPPRLNGEWQPVNQAAITFPLDGATRTVSHDLITARGTTTGITHITLTRIKPF
jgi:hypothetical protein